MRDVPCRFPLALSVGGLLIVGAAAAANGPQFTLQTLDRSFEPQAVNVHGTAVGLRYDGLLAEPVVWSARTGLTQLPALSVAGQEPFPFGSAYAINASGLIGGTTGTAENTFQRATLWPSDGSAPVALPSGGASQPRDLVAGLHDRGLAAGLVAVEGDRVSQAALWDLNGTLNLLADLPTPPGVTTRDSFARDVNLAGSTVGGITHFVDGAIVRVPVRWEGWGSDGTPVALPQPAGAGTLGFAQDMNDAGLVVGNNAGDLLLWNADDELVPLTLPVGITQGRAAAFSPSIDEAGRLLGGVTGVAGTGGQRAALWLDPLAGEAGVLLEDLLDARFAGWTLDEGLDIASDDELVRILAYGTNPNVNNGQRTPVLLTADLLGRLGGDANNDGTVSLADFLILRSNFGTSGGVGFAEGDFNFDGQVSLADFLILRGNFGSGAASLPVPTVPEPMTLSCVGLVGLALLRHRRR